MPANTLDDFIAKKEKERSDFDWDGRKDFWLGAVDALYKDVNKWLEKYVKNGKIEIETTLKKLHEENLGPYEIPLMIIFIQGEKVVLDPIGTLILGGYGRVDLKGKNGTVKLIYLEESSKGIMGHVTISDDSNPVQKARTGRNAEEKLIWKIATAPPEIKLQHLNKKSFQEVLLQVIR
jgi:hypothetical protein